jgi:hypothetical protein
LNPNMETVPAGFATPPLGFAATTKRGPPRTILDSCFRGNDKRGAGFLLPGV